MSLWTLVKLVAALVVLAIMGFSGMLAYHVAVAPLGPVAGGDDGHRAGKAGHGRAECGAWGL